MGKQHPFDNRRLYRILIDEDVVAEGYGYNDAAFDALIDYANRQLPLGIVRTGPDTAVSTGDTSLRLVVVA